MKHIAMIASAILIAPHAMAQDHSDHEGHAPAAEQPPAEDHSQHGDHAQHGDMDHSKMDHSKMDHSGHGADHAAMPSALGSYPMSRDASGTAWQPDAASHGGLHFALPDPNWSAMVHATLEGVYSSQGGPRGDDKVFGAGMIMGSLRGAVSDSGTVQLRAMVSPDPLMGKSGYPLLLAAGETADGVEPLVDRQHPHDFFMELSASYSHKLSDTDSVFVYAGLPGEPAFGPPAFMHRPAAMASPEAPITHHWIDSTHITFGVITAGWVHDTFKLEASRFRGREPDEDRYDIETGALDSTAVRLSWNPTQNWALQASWADVTSPEQLEPDVDATKYSASALYTGEFEGGEVSFTGAFARKESSEDVTLDAWLGEASYRPGKGPWTIFSRFEAIETDELGDHVGHGHHGPVENVMRVSLGASHDFRLSESVVLALGGSLTQNWTEGSLSPLYDGDPVGAMAFVRLKIG
jgi:hypothetical protein